MKIIYQAESTMTSKYQTTIPEPIRSALELKQQDKLRYSVLNNGSVLIEKLMPESSEEADPLIGRFLDFLEDGMTNQPELIRPASASRYAYYRKLAEGER